MIIAFSGCRDREVPFSLLDECVSKGDLVLVGDCPTGVDLCVRTWAREKQYPLAVQIADWASYKLAAGPIRNERMIKQADKLVAFWDGRSKGTKSAINLAVKHHVNFEVIFLWDKFDGS